MCSCRRSKFLITKYGGAGMLATAETIEMVAQVVVKHKIATLVVDPVRSSLLFILALLLLCQ